MKYALHALLALFIFTNANAGEDLTQQAAPPVVEESSTTYLLGAIGVAEESDGTYAVGMGKDFNRFFSGEFLLGHFGQVISTRTDTLICRSVATSTKKHKTSTSKVCEVYPIEEKDAVNGLLLQAKFQPHLGVPLYATGGAVINNDYISPTLGAGLQFGNARIEWRLLFDAEGYNTKEDLNSLSLIYEFR